MGSYLLDTNVVSELRKGQRCNPGVAAWFAGVDREEVYLSVITVGELRKGIESIRRRDTPAADSLETWFQGLLTAHESRILLIDRGVAEMWGRFNVPDPIVATGEAGKPYTLKRPTGGDDDAAGLVGASRK